jgi:hypothetical protein
MNMKAHELAKILLDLPDYELTVSVDVSTCDDDAGNRIFGDILETQTSQGEIVFLCVGSPNY